MFPAAITFSEPKMFQLQVLFLSPNDRVSLGKCHSNLLTQQQAEEEDVLTVSRKSFSSYS